MVTAVTAVWLVSSVVFAAATRYADRMLGRITACMLVVLCAAAHPASAGNDHAIELVESDGRCPTAQELADALRSIFPDVAIRGDGRGDLRVELVRSGDRYRVVAGTAEREFVDPAMRCDERARNAAVFVALCSSRRSSKHGDLPRPEPRRCPGVAAAGLVETAPGRADGLTMTGASSAGWRRRTGRGDRRRGCAPPPR
jgi:hypothetical protein